MAENLEKVVPVIFSHGIGNSMTFFSTIIKDMASQGHVVFSLEHNDRTALHHYSEENGKHKYFKNVDMRDQNTLLKKLGQRVKELDGLIEEV